MSKINKTWLVVASGVMTLCWVCAWSSFLTAALSQPAFSPIPCAQVLFFAAILTWILNRNRLMRVYVLGVHLAGFLLALAGFIHARFQPAAPFFRLGWILDVAGEPRTFVQWMVLILALAVCAGLWCCGVRLVTRPLTRITVSRRFDLGLGMLLCLLLVKLVLDLKGAFLPMPHSSVAAMVAFLISGLFSLGWVRASHDEASHGLVGMKHPGTVVGFTLIPLLLAGGLFVLFLPQLQTAAQTGSGVLASLREYFGPMMVACLRFIFTTGFRRRHATPAGELERPSAILPEGGENPEPQEWILFVLLAVLGIFFLVVCGYVLRRLIRWLREQTGQPRERRSIFEIFFLIFLGLLEAAAWVRTRVLGRFTHRFAGENVYGQLLRWGRLSGVRHVNTETPGEYGLRLAARFPGIQKEIGWIVSAHEEAVYGNRPWAGDRLSKAKMAVRQIHSPRLWLDRMKSRFAHHRV